MAVSLTHAAVVAVPDDGTSPVGSDEWNAQHNLTAGANVVLGTTVAGPVGEIPIASLFASPVFTGDPQAPTPLTGDNDTSIATTAFVTNAVGAIGVGGLSTAEYTYSTTTTVPPTSGQLRGNNVSQSAITAFYLHETNAVGVDITNALKIIATGVKILVQDKTNAANVQYYQTSGPAVDNGAYFTIPVTWTSTGSGTPFTAGRVIFAGFGIGSNNMPEAPTDGSVYGRRGSDTSWQTVATTAFSQPNFRAFLSASQTLTSAVPARINFNVEDFDSSGAYDNVTNFRFTPLKAGKYNVRVHLFIAAQGTLLGSCLAAIYKNGTEIGRARWLVPDATNLWSHTIEISLLVQMNGTTDYLEGWGLATGTTVSCSGNATGTFSYFEAWHIGT
jgi:hypothetical protein